MVVVGLKENTTPFQGICLRWGYHRILSRGRLISPNIAGQAASTGKGGWEWLEGSKLSVSPRSKQFHLSSNSILSFRVPFLINYCLSQEKFEAEFNYHCNSTFYDFGFLVFRNISPVITKNKKVCFRVVLQALWFSLLWTENVLDLTVLFFCKHSDELRKIHPTPQFDGRHY